MELASILIAFLLAMAVGPVGPVGGCECCCACDFCVGECGANLTLQLILDGAAVISGVCECVSKNGTFALTYGADSLPAAIEEYAEATVPNYLRTLCKWGTQLIDEACANSNLNATVAFVVTSDDKLYSVFQMFGDIQGGASQILLLNGSGTTVDCSALEIEFGPYDDFAEGFHCAYPTTATVQAV